MALERIDSLILDVDGTLWDSTPIVAEGWKHAVWDAGLDCEITADILKRLFGKTMKAIAEILFPEASAEQQAKLMELCCIYEHNALEADPCDICYPDVIEGIRKISEKLPVFIVSNCQEGYIEMFLKKTGLEAYVKDIECFGNTRKNKDENIRLLIERNHLKAPVYVGDTQGDCDASLRAGVPFIYASYGFGEASRMDGCIHSFSELVELVDTSLK